MIPRRSFNGVVPSGVDPEIARYLFTDYSVCYPVVSGSFDADLSAKERGVLNLAKRFVPFFSVSYHSVVAKQAVEEILGKQSKTPAGMMAGNRMRALCEQTEQVVGYMARGLDLSKEALEIEYQSLVSKPVPSIPHVLGDWLALVKGEGRVLQDWAPFIAFSFLADLHSQEEMVVKKFGQLAKKGDDVDYGVFLETESGKELAEQGISSLPDLLLCHPYKIIALFLLNTNSFLKDIGVLAQPDSTVLEEIVGNILSGMKKRVYEIMVLRDGRKGETLEVIGRRYGVTRERIRQIEKKGFGYLNRPNARNAIRSAFSPLFEEWILDHSDSFGLLAFEEAEACFKNPNTLDDLLIILAAEGKRPMYSRNENLGLIFQASDYNDLPNIIKSGANTLPFIVGPEQFKALSPAFQRAALSLGIYKVGPEGRYVRGDKEKWTIVLKIVEEAFPDGYRIYDETHYARFERAWKGKFGKNAETPTMVSVRGLVTHHWTLCGEGTYWPEEKSPTLPASLYSEICSFIKDHVPAVYYKSIYYSFKEKLEEIGFTNPSMFKAAFDAIDKKFHHSADYLKAKDWPGAIYDAIVLVASLNKGIFTFDTMRERFPYVENPVFLFCFNKYPKVVHLYNEYYLYVDEKTFSENDLRDLREFTASWIEKTGMGSISASKLYEKLKYVDKTNLLERLQYVMNENALLAIIAATSSHYFETSYTFIGLKGKTPKNRTEALKMYVASTDEFDKSDVDFAMQKYGVSGNYYTFLDVIGFAKETHVQISRDVVLRKALLNLPEDTILTIGQTLKGLAGLLGVIDTRTFDRYSTLPPVPGRTWDKYLLAGVVRSYFSNDYELSYTDPNYKITDFIIKVRRKRNETAE